MPEPSIDGLFERARQHQAAGRDWSHAFSLATFEARVGQWPSGWGDDFVALIFGDFDAPDVALTFDRLGITIQPEKLTGTVVRSALTVLQARVAVSEKSVAAVKDATRRLNLLVGILSYANQGAPVRWWSFVTNPSDASVSFKLGDHNPDVLLALVDLLPPEPRTRVTAALYWLREPRSLLLEHHRAEHLSVYAGYWNAFECLVDAADLLVPRARLSRAAKTEAIRTRLNKVSGSVSPADIEALYREVVDPGLRQKAEHALRLCTGDRADNFVNQCFDYEPRDRTLYSIRNAINHGTVEVDDPETAMMIEAWFPELWGVVFSMLVGLLQKT